LEAIVERVRRDEARFEWALEAGPVTSSAEAPGSWPYGNSPPALSSRQILWRMLVGTAILLSLPWWGVMKARSA
jgi:hypothetical protein